MLEIGFGPGLAIQHVACLVPNGHVVGIDHSALMVKLARRKKSNHHRSRPRRLEPVGCELLPQLGKTFDTVFSVNVLQFLRERSEVRSRVSKRAQYGRPTYLMTSPPNLQQLWQSMLDRE